MEIMYGSSYRYFMYSRLSLSTLFFDFFVTGQPRVLKPYFFKVSSIRKCISVTAILLDTTSSHSGVNHVLNT